jgi:hypothetical protein
MKEVRQLAIQVGLIVLGLALGSCVAGYGISRAGATDASAALRDIGIIILAIFSMITALIWAAIYFGGAAAIARFGPKGPAMLRRLGGLVLRLEAAVDTGTERFVTRPLGKSVRGITTGATFVRELANPERPLESVRRVATSGRTMWNRLRDRAIL